MDSDLEAVIAKAISDSSAKLKNAETVHIELQPTTSICPGMNATEL